METQLRGDVGIGLLLEGQHYIQADTFAPRLHGAAVGGLHDTGAAAGDDHHITVPGGLRPAGDELPQLARLVVIAAVLQGPGGDYRRAPQAIVGGTCLGRGPRLPEALRRGFPVGNPGAAEYDHGRVYTLVALDQVRFEQLQLQAHGPQFLAQQEIGIGESQAIGTGTGLRRVRGQPGSCGVLGGTGKRKSLTFGHDNRSRLVGIGWLASAARERRPLHRGHCTCSSAAGYAISGPAPVSPLQENLYYQATVGYP